MKIRGNRSFQWIGFGLFVAIVLVAVFAFLKFLSKDSAFFWSLEQSEYHQALLETLVVAVLAFCALYFPKRRWVQFFLLTVVLLAFAYLHVFLLPFIAGILYAIMLWMTGNLLCQVFAKKYSDNSLACLLMGMSGLIVLVAVCSLLKIGIPRKLRFVYVVVFVVEAILLRRSMIERVSYFFCARTELLSTKERLVKAGLLAVTVAAFMIQVGRANIALDYDSLWYGIRSNDILAPYEGIYDQLMTTGCVYIYSKAIESLSLAFSFQSTYSFVYAVNLMFTAMVLFSVYTTVCLYCSRSKALFAVMCCAVTAGIMNMGSTAKPDVSTLFVQVVMVYFALRAIKEQDGTALVIALTAGIFSFAFKPTSIVFSGIVLVVIVLMATLYKIKTRFGDWLALLPPIVAALCLFGRSYFLTGVPLSLFGQNLWEMLGFTYQYPYAGRETMSASLAEVLTTPLLWERLERLLHVFFYPNTEGTDHIIIAWGGMLFVVVWLAIIVRVLSHPIRTWKRLKKNAIYAFSMVTLAIISAASVGSMMLLDKPDGNYFMLMYLMTFTHGCLELDYMPKKIRWGYSAAVIPLVACGVLMCLVSHWSWALGFTPIERHNPGIYFHVKDTNQYYQQLQIDELCNELETQEKEPRVMIFSSEIPRLLDIPAVSDSWLDLVYWGNSSLAKSPEELCRYYSTADMKFLLVQGSYLANESLARTHLLWMAEEGHLSITKTQGEFGLLAFHAEKGAPDELLSQWLKELEKGKEEVS